MKKTILFVIDSLDCAGAEKSLISLLYLLDYSEYSVDLMLFAHGKMLENLVPKEVNVLKPLKYTNFARMDLKKAFISSFIKNDYKMLKARIKYSISIRKNNFNNAQKARIFWESISNVIEKNPKLYDIAISYAQGVPTFYVSEKINAKKKFAWVNTSYKLDENEKNFQKSFYDRFNNIVAVSKTAEKILLETFPYYYSKTKVIYDINNPNLIFKLAKIGKSYNDDYQGIRILTIGRLSPGKGYDLALKACKMLKEKGVIFKWYVLGKGPLQKEIERSVKENELIDNFVLLGVEANPYTFIQNADIYVQTSRFEGYGLAIAEARMLNVPVVTTRFDSVFNQMINEKNGLVVDMSAEAVYEGVLKLIENLTLRDEIIKYLMAEKKGNVEELEKFYQLIG